jgi:hypothetical protein
MDSRRIYNSIIDKRKTNIPEGYTETHHIIPRCLGGSDEKDNLVKVTAREHYILHYLLCKIYPSESKLWFALGCMSWQRSPTHKRYIPSRIYSKLKEEYSNYCSERQSGEKNSGFGTRWISDIFDKRSFKIPKSEPLPENCVEGRNKWIINECVCENCGVCFSHKNKKKKFCSTSCRNLVQNPLKSERQKYKGYSVIVDDIVFSSISQAADHFNIKHETARMRFKNKNFKNWKIKENSD